MRMAAMLDITVIIVIVGDEAAEFALLVGGVAGRLLLNDLQGLLGVG